MRFDPFRPDLGSRLPSGQITSYGPSHRNKLLFNGDERNFELWEVKFLGYMRIRDLHSVFANLDDNTLDVDENKNAECFAELVQLLDDRSLSLIIRDARDNGREALKILRQHYLPKGKPRVITLYTQLTSLVKADQESVTDYMLRAETTAASLRDTGETIGDSLLIAMIIKGLPTKFNSFTAVITQKDKELTFPEFKIAIRNYEDTEKIQRSDTSSIFSVKAATDNGATITFSKHSACLTTPDNLVDFNIKREGNLYYLNSVSDGQKTRTLQQWHETMGHCNVRDILSLETVVDGKKPNIANMQPFGSTCYAYVQNPKKLDDRSRKGTFIGFDKGSPAYLVYFPETETVSKIRVVKFAKLESGNSNMHGPAQNCSDENADSVSDDDLLFQNTKKRDTPQPACLPADESSDNSSTNNGFEPRQNITDPTCGDRNNNANCNAEAKRQRSRPKRFDDYFINDEIDDQLNCIIHYCYNVSNLPLPMSYKEAINAEDSDKWSTAMTDEMIALKENDTFELSPLPYGRSVIGGRWVYTVKNGLNNEPKYKARFVAKGYSQMPGIDFKETFSPTARITSVRAMTQIAVQNDLTIHQMDVKSAYLNAPIDCELYVEQPEGFEVEGKPGEKHRPLTVPDTPKHTGVDRRELIRLQQDDEAIKRMGETVMSENRAGRTSFFEKKDGIVYRVYNDEIRGGANVRQVVLPESLRKYVMSVAHDTITGGHLGIKKTREKIMSNFFWPGMYEDVARYCRSCDICQKTVSKGTVQNAPIENIPVVEYTF
ncbi:hypothetical protein EGW08_006573 [Elysia chlorotica]|uniref:Integrase zinc-binding domain-containing protein n=1 Tax=Elysia chlorotica TaxID=188477 RepID=A0A3S1BPJ8_ELYCH|nr:hypothetical protein EGW08_006573 [Elysia chlorotica]